MGNEAEHPALKNFSTTMEAAKGTGKGAIGGAVVGAVAGGIGAAVLGGVGIGSALGAGAGLLGFLGGPLGFITLPLGAVAGGILGAGAITTASIAGGAILGAKAGAVIGGARGLINSGEEIEKKKQNLIDNFERNELRQERREAMDMRRMMVRQQAQSMGMGVTPDGLPRGRGAGGQQLA